MAVVARENRRLYAIAPGLPFLPTLTEWLVQGRIFEDFEPVNNPIDLANAVIYLPTRRAARALSIEILQAMQRVTGNEAVILPRIRTIGDLDEEEVVLGVGNDAILQAGNVIDPPDRLMQLARMARSWADALNERDREMLEREDIVLPSSSADAIRLASDLARFMDQVETEEADWRDIAEFDVGATPEWWQMTLTFLDIVMERWPGVMAEKGQINPAEFRRRLIDFRADELIRNPPEGPVIAAGSTGSIPATARLLKTISRLTNGAVVFSGFDHELPNEIFAEFAGAGELASESVLSTHPQFGLARLVAGTGARQEDVAILGSEPGELSLRGRIINAAMLPAGQSGRWEALRDKLAPAQMDSAFSAVKLVEAAGEHQEAAAIAMALRLALEVPGMTAALVTPDRKLARRVAVELERFGIEIDDTGGQPLAVSEPAVFLRLLLAAVFDPTDPVVLASLLKSRFVAGARSATEARRLGELLELACIRDRMILPGVTELAEAMSQRQAAIGEEHYPPAILYDLKEDDWRDLQSFAEDLAKAMEPLCKLAKSDGLSISAVLQALMDVLQNLATDGTDYGNPLAAAGGRELSEIIVEHGHVADGNFQISPADVAPCFDAILAGKRVREATRSHPRLQIYGQLEARLQSHDLFILGSLNEGSWPQSAVNDPFLNRPMKSALSLPLPERRIGLASHDFVQFSGAPEVIYTRSLREGGAPTVASRWLQRLGAFIGKEGLELIKSRGEQLLHMAGQLDRPDMRIEVERPNYAPPVEARPKSLSITEIETWIRDPYAIYARHVLGLRALPSLLPTSDAAVRGNLLHAILADFVTNRRGKTGSAATELLDETMDRHFRQYGLPPEIEAVWRPAFTKAGAKFVEWDEKRHAEIIASHCEVSGRMEIADTGFTLRGRADRIDVGFDGRLTVVDYKTGSRPGKKEARTLAPQLSLEAAMARAGAFEGIAAAPPGELLYVRMREPFKIDDICKLGTKTTVPDELADQALEDLTNHIRAYQSPQQGYLSRYAPVSAQGSTGDYDHLARVREWSIAEGNDDDDGQSGEGE